MFILSVFVVAVLALSHERYSWIRLICTYKIITFRLHINAMYFVYIGNIRAIKGLQVYAAASKRDAVLIVGR